MSFRNKKRAVRQRANSLAVNYPGNFQLIINHSPNLRSGSFAGRKGIVFFSYFLLWSDDGHHQILVEIITRKPFYDLYRIRDLHQKRN